MSCQGSQKGHVQILASNRMRIVHGCLESKGVIAAHDIKQLLLNMKGGLDALHGFFPIYEKKKRNVERTEMRVKKDANSADITFDSLEYDQVLFRDAMQGCECPLQWDLVWIVTFFKRFIQMHMTDSHTPLDMFKGDVSNQQVHTKHTRTYINPHAPRQVQRRHRQRICGRRDSQWQS